MIESPLDRPPFFELFVRGEPQPKGSLTPVVKGTRWVKDRHTGRLIKKPRVQMIPGLNRKRKDGSYSEGREKYESWVRNLTAACTAWLLTHRDPTGEEQPLRATLIFFMPRPPSLPARIKVPFKKPDLDKLARCVYDCLTTAKVIFDDSRVVTHFHDKRFETRETPNGVQIKLWRL